MAYKFQLDIRPPGDLMEGSQAKLKVIPPPDLPLNHKLLCSWTIPKGVGEIVETGPERFGQVVHWDLTNAQPGDYEVSVVVSKLNVESIRTDANLEREIDETDLEKLDWCTEDVTIVARPALAAGQLAVRLRRAGADPTIDIPLWVVIRRSTSALSFENYQQKMRLLLCDPQDKGEQPAFSDLRKRRFLPYNDTDSYRLLKVATEAFVMVNSGVMLRDFDFTDWHEDATRRLSTPVTLRELEEWWGLYLKGVVGSDDLTLPYLALVRDKLSDQRIKRALFPPEEGAELPEECYGILREKLTMPCLLELIWSYWHEEGMLVQTMGALSTRFQNVRAPGHDPLATLEIDPLRPLNNLLWGYIQDEQHRLTLARRAFEYDHHYGFRLEGRAVPSLRAADSRTKFLEAFHNLLFLCAVFFKEDDDTTVIADGFPVLNALKDVHLILSEGAHNQFGDLPSTSRVEMLMQQWLLARPEFREFLPTRIMVAYPEPWMDRVDAMKSIQNWTDVSVLHFRNLGAFGEQLLLSIRYGAWSGVNDPAQAANWARYWRAEVQGYIHAYRATTGVDLTAEITDQRQAQERFVMPSVHLKNRLLAQRRTGAIGAGEVSGMQVAAGVAIRPVGRRRR